jgi:predicted nucleic acid-binding protein
MSPNSSAKAALTSPSELDLVVVDASVLVELVTDGRHSRNAEALLAAYTAPEGIVLITAAHGLVEATNAMRKLVLRGILTVDDGLAAVEELGDLDLLLDVTGARLRRIWSLRDRMSAYDAAYAAAAEALNAPLLTADDRLLRACRDAAIRAIGLEEIAPPT